jgi:hypothetical protein|tara:strand:+ start:236 stop:583 length:348 start_codon:yes stop_codon:yes gene_type:complete
MTSSNDRFDLEQAIMNAWSTCDDIDLIYHNTDKLDLNAKDCDDLQNQLLGLRSIAELRFEKVWDIFESLVSTRKLDTYNSMLSDTYNTSEEDVDIEEYLTMLHGLKQKPIDFADE